MMFFIPAWYKENSWSENERVWYWPKLVTEFDDTVKQIQLFSRNYIGSYGILLLSHAPNLRHFLHRQGIYHAPYWSCFDAMQGIRTRKLMPYSFHDLNWPEGIRFVYTPFAVVAVRDNRKMAQIEFAEGGSMMEVDLYQDDVLTRKNLYDDRGFVSCSVLYRKEKPWCEQYFNEQGVWKFCRFLDDGHVEINEESAFYLLRWGETDREIPYRKKRYEDLSGLIEEVAGAFLSQTGENDIFTVAMHQMHTKLLRPLLSGRKCILSFFGQRREITSCEDTRRMLDDAGYIVVSSQADRENLESRMGRTYLNVEIITPYDSRIESGISQQLHVQNVLLTVDGVSEPVFEELVLLMAAYMKTHPRVRTHLFTRRAQFNRRAQILGKVRGILTRAGENPLWAREKTSGRSENTIDSGHEAPVLFYADQCVDEMAMNTCLRKMRLMVDLQPEPDPFLQISAMSMGIPQITAKRTPYIEDGKNGRIVKDPKVAASWLPFYLENISNWNDAMIASYDLGSHYTADRLAEQWKKIIDDVERTRPAAGARG